MKKIGNSILFVLMMVVMVCALTGCGDDKKSDSDDSKESNSDVLVATKSEEESAMGSYKETIEITFKAGDANSVKETMEFDDESTAKYIGSLMQMTASSLDGMDYSQEGKKIIITMDPEAFLKELGGESDLSRDAIENNLKTNGFTIEK